MKTEIKQSSVENTSSNRSNQVGATPTDTIAELGREYVGNWSKWSHFAFHKWDFDHPENVCIYEHGARHAMTLLQESNMCFIEKALEPFTYEKEDGSPSDVHFTMHSSSLVGPIDAIVIRVYDNDGNITEAFTVFAKMIIRLESHPVLDNDDFSYREFEYFQQRFDEEINWILNKYDIDLDDEYIERDGSVTSIESIKKEFSEFRDNLDYSEEASFPTASLEDFLKNKFSV